MGGIDARHQPPRRSARRHDADAIQAAREAFFKSVGNAMQDLVLGARIYERAQALGLGADVPLSFRQYNDTLANIAPLHYTCDALVCPVPRREVAGAVESEVVEVRVGPHGRVVIPAPLRKALGVAVGDTLIARREDGRLVLEKPETILDRIYALFQGIPPDVSLADELIQERRAEARGEDTE